MKSYSTFIRTAKQYANQGESQRLNLMMLLVEVEPRKSLWQSNPNKTKSWDMLLRDEGLCTPALYGDFKRALKIVKVETFGVYAAAAIVKVPAKFRSRVVRDTQKWIDSHKVRPTYQRITKYVAELKKELGIHTSSSSMQVLRAKNRRLERELTKANEYIDTLQAVLKKNQIRYPREP